MYKTKDYIQRGRTLLHNRMFPARRRLSTLMIYATDLCDSACKHCLIWKKRPVQYLPASKIFEVMRSRAITDHTTVGLEGGEFLLHPESLEIMKWFRQNHPRFDLLSNCLKPEKTIEAVRKYPPIRLFVSLDGTREGYLSMRGKDGYESVLETIRALKNTVPISVMFCASPFNSMEDLRHVSKVCTKEGVDLRVGVYSNIDFFATETPAHQEPADMVPPPELKEHSENYEYILLYNEWKKGNLKMSCNSIVDSGIILPDGDVPLCLNLGLKLGNLYKQSFDEILNSAETRMITDSHRLDCNKCFINFHRKYDLILYRQFERFFPKSAVSKLFGYHQWSSDPALGYRKTLKELNSARS